MNPEAFMLLDRLEKLMLAAVAASLQSHSRPCRLHVVRLKRYFIEVWGGGVGEGRVHTEDTFSVPLGSLQPGWPTSLHPCDPTHYLNVHLLCARSLNPLGLRFFFVDFFALHPRGDLRRSITKCIVTFVNLCDPGQRRTPWQSCSVQPTSKHAQSEIHSKLRLKGTQNFL